MDGGFGLGDVDGNAEVHAAGELMDIAYASSNLRVAMSLAALESLFAVRVLVAITLALCELSVRGPSEGSELVSLIDASSWLVAEVSFSGDFVVAKAAVNFGRFVASLLTFQALSAVTVLVAISFASLERALEFPALEVKLVRVAGFVAEVS